LYKAVGEAADANRLPMSKEEALKKFSELTATMGLLIRPGEDAFLAQAAPQADYGSYSNSSELGSYYYNQGPPLVTYYTPPWDYYSIYRWVPYSFWWGRAWFGGFFILNDFYTYRKVVVVEKHGHRYVTHKRVTNHYYNWKRKRFGRVDPFHRPEGYRYAGFRHAWNGRGFGHGQAQRRNEPTYKRYSTPGGSFRERQIGRRDGSLPGENHGFRGRPSMSGINSFRRNEGTRTFQSSAGRGRFGQSHREMGRAFENHSNRFTRDRHGTFGRRPGAFGQSSTTGVVKRGGAGLRSHSFSSGGRGFGTQSFSNSSRRAGHGFSRGAAVRGGGFSGGGFSMGRSFGGGGRR